MTNKNVKIIAIIFILSLAVMPITHADFLDDFKNFVLGKKSSQANQANLRSSSGIIKCDSVTEEFPLNKKFDENKLRELHKGLINNINNKGALQFYLQERKKALIETMQVNPSYALSNVLSKQDRDKLSKISSGCIETPIVVEGTLEYLHTHLEDNTIQDQYFILAGNNERIILHPTTNRLKVLISGYKVKVKGLKIDNSLVFDDSSPVSSENDYGFDVLGEPEYYQGGIEIQGRPSFFAPPVLGDQKLLVILVNFNDAVETQLTASQVRSFIFDAPTSLNSFYKENSFNKISVSGDVVGWYNLPISRYSSDTAIAENAVAAADPYVDFRNYDQVMVIGRLSMTGRATVGKRGWNTQDGHVYFGVSWVNSYSSNTLDYVYLHEFGHTLGTGHASSFDCPNSIDCPFVGFEGFSEYGDHYDIMGTGLNIAGHFNTLRKDFMGWFDDSQIIYIHNQSQNGVYTIEPIESNSNGIKGLRINRPDYNYMYLGYRQPIGYDSTLRPEVFDGLSFHIPSGISWTLLLDSVPLNPSRRALYVGESVKDPFTGTNITVLSKNSQGITVNVTFGPKTDFISPTINNLMLNNQPITYGEFVVSSNITLGINVFDNVGIEKVEYFVLVGVPNGIDPKFILGTSTIPPFNLEFDTTKIPNTGINFIPGTTGISYYNLYALVYDNSGTQYGLLGNAAVSEWQATLFVNNTGDRISPTGSILTPNNTVYPDHGNLKVSANDNRGIGLIDIYSDLSNNQPSTHIRHWAILNPNISNTYDLTLSFGNSAFPWFTTRKLYVNVTDLVGNSIITIPSITIHLGICPDGRPVEQCTPTISASHSPLNPYQGQLVTLTAAATDNTGLSAIELFVDNNKVRTCNVSGISASCTYTTSSLSGGIHTYYAIANNTAGISTTSSTNQLTVGVDTNPPTVSVTHSPANPLVGQNITLSATATDNIALANISIHLDNVRVKFCTSSPCTYSIIYQSAGSHNYNATAYDSSNNRGRDPVSGTKSFTVLADTIPPVRSNGFPSGVLQKGTTSTTLSLTTDESATCKYATTQGVVYNSMPNTFTTTGSTIHSKILTGLTNGSTYQYYVKCKDAKNNTNADDYLIALSVQESTPPTITNIVESIGTNSAVISWSTNENATSVVKYGIVQGQYTSTSTGINGISHSVTLNNLQQSKTYYYKVNSTDAAGNSRETNPRMFSTKSGGPSCPECQGCTYRDIAQECTFYYTPCDGYSMINDIRLSNSNVALGADLTVNVDYSCYADGTYYDLALWYFNGNTWRLITTQQPLSGCDYSPDTDNTFTYTFRPDQSVGTHYVRPSISSGGIAHLTECLGYNTWNDFDDMQFSVVESSGGTGGGGGGKGVIGSSANENVVDKIIEGLKGIVEKIY